MLQIQGTDSAMLGTILIVLPGLFGRRESFFGTNAKQGVRGPVRP